MYVLTKGLKSLVVGIVRNIFFNYYGTVRHFLAHTLKLLLWFEFVDVSWDLGAPHQYTTAVYL